MAKASDGDAPAPSRRWPRRLRDHALAIIAGCMVFMSFPTWDLFPLQWFALVPLLWVIADKTPRRAAWYGWIAGFVTNTGGFHWMEYLLQEFGHLPRPAAISIMLLMTAYQGVVFLLWAWLSVRLRARSRFGFYALAPAAFVAVEFTLPFIFPWFMANGQQPFHAASQMIDLAGVAGLTYLIVAVNVALYEVARAFADRRAVRWRPAAATAAAFVAAIVYGLIRIAQVDAQVEEAPKLRIGMVEANIGIWEKEAKYLQPHEKIPTLYANLLSHQMFSRDLEKEGVDLIVWPESSYLPLGDTWTKSVDVFALAAGRKGELYRLNREGSWLLPTKTRGSTQEAGASRPAGDVHAVWAGREDTAFAVGDGGLVLEWTGNQLRPVDVGIDRALRAVHGVPVKGDVTYYESIDLMVFAAGDGGALLQRTPSGAWTTVDLGVDQGALVPAGASLRALAGRTADRVFALGDGGVALKWDGRTWSALPNAPFDVRAASVGPDAVLWVVGPSGQTARLADGRWDALPSTIKSDLNAVAAFGPKFIVAVGDGGAFLRFDGERWQMVETGVAATLTGVMSAPRGGIVVTGHGGTALRLKGGQFQRMPVPDGGDLLAVAPLDYEPHRPMPRDVLYVRPAVSPLPVGATAKQAEARDRSTPSGERNAVHRGFTTPVLFGALTYERTAPPERRRLIYNTALLLDGEGKVMGAYDKVYLLAFGEYIPFENHVSPETRRWLHELIPEAGNFEAGTTVQTFPFRDYQLGVMVCYEDILPSFTNRLAALDPNVIINVTNDAWFGKTSEPYLHLGLAAARAIENRVSLVRSTNTGVSAFIDPVGRIRKQTSLEGAEVLIDDVPMMESWTVYRATGDIFAIACILWVLGMFVRTFRRRNGTDTVGHAAPAND